MVTDKEQQMSSKRETNEISADIATLHRLVFNFMETRTLGMVARLVHNRIGIRGCHPS